MMHLFCRCHATLCEALLTVGVSLIILVPDAFPTASILLVYVGCAFILIVLSSLLRPVLLTILLVSQPGATRIGTRMFRLSRHMLTSDADEKRTTFTGFFP